jgi:hypothetical protein
MTEVNSNVRNRMINKIKFFLDTEFQESSRNPLPALNKDAKKLLMSMVYETSRSRANTGNVFEVSLDTGSDLDFGDTNFTDTMYGIGKFRIYIEKFVSLLEVREYMEKGVSDERYVMAVCKLMKRKPIDKNVEILMSAITDAAEQKDIAFVTGVPAGNISRMIKSFREIEENVANVESLFEGELLNKDN